MAVRGRAARLVEITLGVSMLTIAIQTSRANSLGVPHKNLLEFGGKPLFRYGLELALGCESLDEVFVVSDVLAVHEAARELGCGVIELPPELAEGNHHGAIRFGVLAVERALGREVEAVTVLLGNALGTRPQELDQAIELLAGDPALDSVVSVSEFSMFNPSRAFRFAADGRLEAMLSADALSDIRGARAANERHALGETWFFNGSFWVIRRAPLLTADGPPPFAWLGHRIAGFRQRTLMELDEAWQIPVLATMVPPSPESR
ncbi:MAG: hypothetical protein R6X02_03990 [Enhygromyxa sp.]